MGIPNYYRGDSRIQWGTTALHVTCYHSQNIEVVEELLKNRANINVNDAMGKMPLLCLASYHERPVDKHRLQIACLLLEANCDVNHKTVTDETAFSLAVDHDLHELALLLVEYGATISSNALLHCKLHGKVDTMAFLLKHGSDINAQNYKGYTTLHFAAAGGKVDQVQLLLNQNADVSIVDRRTKCTALMAAILKNVNFYHSGPTDQGKVRVDENQLLIVHLLLE